MDRKQVAYRFSQIFHPAIIEIPAATTALYLYNIGPEEIFLFAVLPIAGLTTALYLILRIPRYRGLDMNIRDDRAIMYPPAVALLLIMTALTHRFNGPELVKGLYPGMIAVSMVNFAVNRKIKISLHTTGMGVVTAVFTGLDPLFGAVFFILSGLVGWSRVVLGRHSLTEVILGFFVSYSLILTSLLVYLGNA